MTRRPREVATWRPVLVVIGALALVVVLRSTLVPGRFHFVAHVAVIGGLCALAWWYDVDRDELGLARRTIAPGARVGALVFVAVGAMVAVGSWIVAADDDRVDVSLASMLLKVLVVIPVGTVVMEELAFRGLLLALCRRVTSTSRAVLVSSVAFGCWHVVTAWNTSDGGDAVRTWSVLGTVVGTTLAGFAFCWLRLRWHSLLVPVGAHLATNSVAFAATWLALR